MNGLVFAMSLQMTYVHDYYNRGVDKGGARPLEGLGHPWKNSQSNSKGLFTLGFFLPLLDLYFK